MIRIRVRSAGLNYVIACRHCNETLKKNLFPIERQRQAASVDPTLLADEQAVLIYPPGTHDADPEDLIEFFGLTPMPRHSSGFEHRRALVTSANIMAIVWNGSELFQHLLYHLSP